MLTLSIPAMAAENDLQMRATARNIVDRGWRFAGKFHGLNFRTINAVLNINGLLNYAHT